MALWAVVPIDTGRAPREVARGRSERCRELQADKGRESGRYFHHEVSQNMNRNLVAVALNVRCVFSALAARYVGSPWG